MSFPCHVSDTLVINGVYVKKKSRFARIYIERRWIFYQSSSQWGKTLRSFSPFSGTQQQKSILYKVPPSPVWLLLYYNIYTHITYSITLKVYEKAPPHSAHRAAAAAAKATLTAQANNTHAYVVIVALFQSRGSVEYQHVMCKLLWMKNLLTQGPLIQ